MYLIFLLCLYHFSNSSLVFFFFFNDSSSPDICTPPLHYSLFFFFNDPAPTEISPFPLHDALPIYRHRLPRAVPLHVLRAADTHCAPGSARRGLRARRRRPAHRLGRTQVDAGPGREPDQRPTTTSPDRKSTRLNSSHQIISYAVFCLKKKKNSLEARRTAHRPDAGDICSQTTASRTSCRVVTPNAPGSHVPPTPPRSSSPVP